MSIGLNLWPVDHLSGDYNWGYCHSILGLGSVSYQFVDLVKANAKQIPMPHEITSYGGALVPSGMFEGESMYGHIRSTDGYGEPYTWITAEHLLVHLEDERPNSPITAYVRALSATALIILDWA